jgi:hypothetical protein
MYCWYNFTIFVSFTLSLKKKEEEWFNHVYIVLLDLMNIVKETNVVLVQLYFYLINSYFMKKIINREKHSNEGYPAN